MASGDGLMSVFILLDNQGHSVPQWFESYLTDYTVFM